MEKEKGFMEFKGKTAIVTGGNSGIGLVISTALARVGMNIVVAGRRQHQNESVARELAQRMSGNGCMRERMFRRKLIASN
jgi:NAD(P)-dependent dehydrogenase (short-subunit alcohol dehydrogenase family)